MLTHTASIIWKCSSASEGGIDSGVSLRLTVSSGTPNPFHFSAPHTRCRLYLPFRELGNSFTSLPDVTSGRDDFQRQKGDYRICCLLCRRKESFPIHPLTHLTALTWSTFPSLPQPLANGYRTTMVRS